MVAGFTTTCAIITYDHVCCEFEPRSWRGILDTTLCDEVYQWLATGQWFPLWWLCPVIADTTSVADNSDSFTGIFFILVVVRLTCLVLACYTFIFPLLLYR
jgi:hypothetical protein